MAFGWFAKNPSHEFRDGLPQNGPNIGAWLATDAIGHVAIFYVNEDGPYLSVVVNAGRPTEDDVDEALRRLMEARGEDDLSRVGIYEYGWNMSEYELWRRPEHPTTFDVVDEVLRQAVQGVTMSGLRFESSQRIVSGCRPLWSQCRFWDQEETLP